MAVKKPSPLTVKVLYFGLTRDMAGGGEEEFTLEPPASVCDLLVAAEKKHRSLAQVRSVIRVAIDEELVREEALLKGGETVVVLPPVAGG